MRLKNTYREKLLNAILYFCKKTQKTSKVKIFKLLYFLDFQHFKETGRSVTNLDYQALDFGPVPENFYNEVKNNAVPDDFSKSLTLVPFSNEETGKSGAVFKAKKTPDLSVFSPREQRILRELVEIFKEVDASDISEISHLKNKPWDKTKKEKGLYKTIDYLLALDDESKIPLEKAKEAIRDRSEMIRNFPPIPRIQPN